MIKNLQKYCMQLEDKAMLFRSENQAIKHIVISSSCCYQTLLSSDASFWNIQYAHIVWAKKKCQMRYVSLAIRHCCSYSSFTSLPFISTIFLLILPVCLAPISFCLCSLLLQIVIPVGGGISQISSVSPLHLLSCCCTINTCNCHRSGLMNP